MKQFRPWAYPSLLGVFGIFVSYFQPILMTSLLYSLALLALPFSPFSTVFWQLSPVALLIVFARMLPIFIGYIAAASDRKLTLSSAALAGGVFELLRAGALQMAWGDRVSELTLMVQRDGRVYQWIDTEVAVSVLSRLYPIQVRVLAAAMLAVLGVMIFRTKKEWVRLVFIFSATLIIVLAT